MFQIFYLPTHRSESSRDSSSTVGNFTVRYDTKGIHSEALSDVRADVFDKCDVTGGQLYAASPWAHTCIQKANSTVVQHISVVHE